MNMNKKLVEFCEICWHEKIKTESKLSCSCGKTYAFSAPAHKEFIDSVANSELHKKFACTNPDFSGKDFHLLHTAMGEKGKWSEFYNFLDCDGCGSPFWVKPLDFHELPFTEQAKLIYEFIKGDV